MERVVASFASVVAIVLVSWIMIMMAGMIGRAFFNVSWMFLDEYTGYFNMAVGTLGLGYAVIKSAHINMSLVVSRIPRQVRLVLEFLAAAVYIWWAITLSQKMAVWLTYSLETGAHSGGTNTPLWIPYLIAVLGFVVFGLATLALLLHLVIKALHGTSEDNGSDAQSGQPIT